MGRHKGQISYRKEFFDREYTAREAYGRLWTYARRYRARLVFGVICGILTAGTLVSFFSVIQPALEHVEKPVEVAREVERDVKSEELRVVSDGAEEAAPTTGHQQPTANHQPPTTKSDKKAKGLIKDYGKVRKWAQKLGVDLQGEDEELGLPLLLLNYVGTHAVLVTLLTVLVFLGPQFGYKPLLSGPDFFLHLFCPLLALISYLAWDRPPMTPLLSLIGVIPVLLYGLLYLRKVVYAKQWEDFYGFNRGGHWPRSFAAMLLGAALLCLLLRL